MKWTVKEGRGDPLLAIAPLQGGITAALAIELIRDGAGKYCGECGKPFTVARKWRGIARVTQVDMPEGLYCTAWLLCGKCNAEMKRNGNRPSDKLIGQARAAVTAGRVLLAPTRGNG